jgi:hypothetical protein
MMEEYMIIILIVLLALAISVAYLLGKAWYKASADKKAALGEIENLKSIMEKREEIYNEAQNRKDSMAAGSDADRFNSSLDVLHDISGGGKPAPGPVADVPGSRGKGDPGPE